MSSDGNLSCGTLIIVKRQKHFSCGKKTGGKDTQERGGVSRGCSIEGGSSALTTWSLVICQAEKGSHILSGQQLRSTSCFGDDGEKYRNQLKTLSQAITSLTISTTLDLE